MSVQCIDCEHFTKPKGDYPGDIHMLRAGFAVCDIRPGITGEWLSGLYPRECGEFALSPDSAKRRAWVMK